MAHDYPDPRLLEPDPLHEAVKRAIDVMRQATRHMALPTRRRLLTDAADELERELHRRR